MEKIAYKVPAIHCDHCVHTIKMELSELDGVDSVQVSNQDKTVDITFSPPATEQKIKDLLVEINYPPEL